MSKIKRMPFLAIVAVGLMASAVPVYAAAEEDVKESEEVFQEWLTFAQKREPLTKEERKQLDELFLKEVKNGNQKVVERFLHKGADVNVNAQKGSASSAIVIDGVSYRKTALTIAADANNGEMVKMLVTAHADVNARDKEGLTALTIATKKNNNEIVRMLVAAHADPNVPSYFLDGDSLHIAASKGFNEIVKILIAGKARINARETTGSTPLNCAVSYNHYDTVVLLLESGADIEVGDQQDWPPLMRAIGRENLKVMNILLAYGARVNGKKECRMRMSPLEWAASLNSTAMVTRLIFAGACPINCLKNRNFYGSWLSCETKKVVEQAMKARSRVLADIGRLEGVLSDLVAVSALSQICVDIVGDYVMVDYGDDKFLQEFVQQQLATNKAVVEAETAMIVAIPVNTVRAIIWEYSPEMRDSAYAARAERALLAKMRVIESDNNEQETHAAAAVVEADNEHKVDDEKRDEACVPVKNVLRQWCSLL